MRPVSPARKGWEGAESELLLAAGPFGTGVAAGGLGLLSTNEGSEPPA